MPDSDGLLAVSALDLVTGPEATAHPAAPLTTLSRTRAVRPRQPERLADARALAAWTCLVLVLNLVWYGVFLSFPLLGEDGAANYSSLTDTIRTSSWLSTAFPIKWSEGLGQPNPFTSLTFDPFSWIMLSGLELSDAFRVSYALRATACWLGTYLFVFALFRGARTLALTAAFVCVLLNFTLANVSGSNTFAAIDVATQAALFPIVLWLYLVVARAGRGVSWRDGAFGVALALLLLSYPIHSAIGLVVIGIFAVCHFLTSPRLERWAAAISVTKLIVISSVLLLTPAIGLSSTWAAIGAISARFVFAEELTTYLREYDLPYFWHDVPVALRAIVVLALAVVLLRRVPRPMRTTLLTAAVVLGGTQVETVARFFGVLPAILERLPRPFYTEFYLPPFYAIAAAYVLSRWSRMLSAGQSAALRTTSFGLRTSSGQCHRGLGVFAGAAGTTAVFTALSNFDGAQLALTRFMPEGSARTLVLVGAAAILIMGVWICLEWLGSTFSGRLSRFAGWIEHALPPAPLVWWTAGVFAFLLGTRLVVERWDIALVICGALLAIALTSWLWPRGYRRVAVQLRHVTPSVAVLALVAGGWATWQFSPEQIHPLFGPQLICQNRTPWCRDAVGATMGAAATPVTDFLAGQLSTDQTFRGRADYILTPGFGLARLALDPTMPLSATEFQMLNNWYLHTAHEQTPWSEPTHFSFAQSQALISTLRAQAEQGLLSEDTVMQVVDWVNRSRPELSSRVVLSNWGSNSEVSFMVAERNLNFRATGNGMLLRALPLQQIPVASSYELSLDYLYYLLWTRYLNEGSAASRSINMTNLEVVRAPRLALLGVQLIVARDVPNQPAPGLPRIWSWGNYAVYRVADANTGAYGVRRLLFAPDLTAELRTMRDPGFDPRDTAVAPEDERALVNSTGGSSLSPLDTSSLTLEGQSIHFVAASAGAASVAVLPFKYSHCWEPTWSGLPGRVIRLDVGLVGISFQENTDVTLHWNAGYFSGTECLRQDATLLPQALAAARELK